MDVHLILLHVVQLVQLVLLVVEALEDGVEKTSSDETRNSQTGVGPDQLGVFGSWRKSNTDGRTEGVGDKEKGSNEGLHCHGSFCVGVLQTGN